MPKVVYASEKTGCGADILLESGEICMVSIAQSGVLVCSYKPGFFKRMKAYINGPFLYKEKDVYAAAKTAMTLSEKYPEEIPELRFNNPVLGAFANAIWHCSSAAEVSVVLNEAAKA